jgi:predicted MFS family arabinose efflux permease
MTVAARPATYREVFAEPSFRTLFVARTFAVSATSLQIFALSVLVYASTGSPLLSALAFGAGFLPQFAGGLLLGSLTDRLPARPLIVTGYAAEAALSATLGLVDLPVAAALLLVAAMATITPVFAGAASKVIAERLTGDAYVLGRAVSSMSSSIAQLLGLAGGGVAVAALGTRDALLLAAAGFVIAAAVVHLALPAGAGSPRASGSWGTPGSPGAGGGSGRSAGKRRGAVRDSWTGARDMLADRTIRRLLLAQWLPCALAVGAEALLVSYAARRGLPPGSGALLMGAPAAGMLLGDLIVGRFVKPAWRERLTGPLVLLLGAPLLLLPLNPPLPATVTLLVLSGFGFAYSLGLQRAFLEAAPPDRVGQLFALLSTGMMALQGTGPLLAGALAELTSPATAAATAGAATMLAAVLTRKTSGCRAPLSQPPRGSGTRQPGPLRD